jgi:hypothetical protein
LSKSAVFILGLLCAGACRNTSKTPEPDAGKQPSAAAVPSGAALTAEDTDIQPVYPVDAGPPDPLAAKFCDAALGLPIRRRAECCGEDPGFSAAGECVRTLTHALRVRAVELKAAEVDSCAAAATASLTGCGWVGSSRPPVPEACRNVVRGLLAAETACRSSLECSAGLHCHGLSATSKGVCGKARPDGALCGAGIDTLAAYTAQARVDAEHPECDKSYCSSGRCTAFVAPGQACTGNAQCGPDASCRASRCSAQGLPRAGERCSTDECAEGFRCVRGSCVTPKNEGESCELDAECRGACLRPDAGGAGRCGMRCPVFSLPKPAVPPAKATKPKKK